MKLPFSGWVVAAALLTSMVGMGAWDFERAIARLDAIEQNTGLDHTQIVVNKNDIAGLLPRVAETETRLTDHERRIIRLEPR